MPLRAALLSGSLVTKVIARDRDGNWHLADVVGNELCTTYSFMLMAWPGFEFSHGIRVVNLTHRKGFMRVELKRVIVQGYFLEFTKNKISPRHVYLEFPNKNLTREKNQSENA